MTCHEIMKSVMNHIGISDININTDYNIHSEYISPLTLITDENNNKKHKFTIRYLKVDIS